MYAIQANERIFLSGQIGLRPSDLTLPSPQSLATETALSCQHVQRITDALRNNSGGGWTGHYQGMIYWLTCADDVHHVRKASLSCAKVSRPASPRDSDSHHEMQDQQVPAIFAVVSALPKNAIIEKQVLLHTGQCWVNDDGDNVLRPISPTFAKGWS